MFSFNVNVARQINKLGNPGKPSRKLLLSKVWNEGFQEGFLCSIFFATIELLLI